MTYYTLARRADYRFPFRAVCTSGDKAAVHARRDSLAAEGTARDDMRILRTRSDSFVTIAAALRALNRRSSPDG